MKAIFCTRLGGPDDLELAELPMPVAAAGEAVVGIKAVGLNFYDTLIIAGKYQTKPPLPFSPGGKFAGVIERVGAGVSGFPAGDRVLGYTGFGRRGTPPCRWRSSTVSASLSSSRARPGSRSPTGPLARAQRPRRPQGGQIAGVFGASGGVGLAAVELGALMGARR